MHQVSPNDSERIAWPGSARKLRIGFFPTEAVNEGDGNAGFALLAAPHGATPAALIADAAADIGR